MLKHPKIVHKFERVLSSYSENIAVELMVKFKQSPEFSSTTCGMLAINRFLRAQLERCDLGPIMFVTDPRNYVRDDVSEKDWLLLIEDRIIPILINKWSHLPK